MMTVGAIIAVILTVVVHTIRIRHLDAQTKTRDHIATLNDASEDDRRLKPAIMAVSVMLDLATAKMLTRLVGSVAMTVPFLALFDIVICWRRRATADRPRLIVALTVMLALLAIGTTLAFFDARGRRAAIATTVRTVEPVLSPAFEGNGDLAALADLLVVTDEVARTSARFAIAFSWTLLIGLSATAVVSWSAWRGSWELR